MSQLPEIADLDNLGLSDLARAARGFTIGGSDATIIAGDDEGRIIDLWRVKTGRQESEDLSRVLPVIMGSWTEPLNAAYFIEQTGYRVFGRDTALTCPTYEWRTATLDGYVEIDGNTGVWEAKHVNAFAKPAEVIAKYRPQLVHNMDVAGVDFAVLSVLKGTTDWFFHIEQHDIGYASDLERAELAFYEGLMTDTCPVDIPTPKAPVPPSEMRSVDMTGNNEWAYAAGEYLDSQAAKKRFDQAQKTLKALVEDDVREATGHGVAAVRDARGAIRFKEIA